MMRAEIFEEREGWSGPLVAAIAFHALDVVVIIVIGYFGVTSKSNWGGDSSGGTTGSAVNATLVSSAGVPLPHPQPVTDNIVATENKGVTQTAPQAPEEDKNAIATPDNIAKNHIDKIPTPPGQKPPQPPTSPPNVVAYGEGGPVSGPYGAFSAAHVKGGFSFQGGGDFGSRYGWYVQVVNTKTFVGEPSGLMSNKI